MPVCSPIGPLDAKVVLVGEAPGETEEEQGQPFVGASGQELSRCLVEAGLAEYETKVTHIRVGANFVPRESRWIDRSHLHLCNVFTSRPPYNDILKWMVGKKDLPTDYDIPPYARGKFLHPSFVPELRAFHDHMAALSPNIIVALGGTALWALTGATGITALRGAVIPTPYGKVLPTFHPAAILRAWGNRPILVADLIKARLHSADATYTRPSRRLLIQPTIDEVEAFYEEHLRNARRVAADVETKRGQITSCSFAVSPTLGITIPFWDQENEGNYWNSVSDELRAWRVVRNVVSGPAIKIMQNGLYDTQYFLRHRIVVRNFLEDTMIAQHAQFPEHPKSLGFLGSILTDEPAWKVMRTKAADTVKRDE